MAKSKIALVGLGVMGLNHLRTLQGIETVELIGAADKKKPKDLSIPFFYDYQELLDHKPDGVVIATPTSTHKKIALQCLQHQIPVLIEKPVAATVQEALEIKHAFAKSIPKVSAHVGYIERFNPAVEVLKQQIKGLEIAKVQITRVGPYPKRITDVGILCDLSVHDFDLLRYICEDEFVSHAIYDTQTKHTYEDSAFINGQMSRGTIVAISTSWLSPIRRREIIVYTKDLYFKVDLLTKRVWKYPIIESDQELGSEEIVVPARQALESELNEWLTFLKTNKTCRLATVEDSLKTLELITANLSSQSSRIQYPKAELEKRSFESLKTLL